MGRRSRPWTSWAGRSSRSNKLNESADPLGAGRLPVPVPTPWFNSAQRTAAALMLAGLLHGTLFALLLRMFTNDRNVPAVRRAHTGTRMVFAGIIWMTADTAALLIVFAEGFTDWNQLAEWTGIGLVWGPAAAVQLWLLLRDRDRAQHTSSDQEA